MPDACVQIGDEGGSLLVPQFATLHKMRLASPYDLSKKMQRMRVVYEWKQVFILPLTSLINRGSQDFSGVEATRIEQLGLAVGSAAVDLLPKMMFGDTVQV